MEGSQLDWANHANDYPCQLGEMLAFDDAVNVVRDWIGANEHRKERTLLIRCDGQGAVRLPRGIGRLQGRSQRMKKGCHQGSPSSFPIRARPGRAADCDRDGRLARAPVRDATYNIPWTGGAVHDWLKAIRPTYVIDINRDTQLLDSYADVPHTLALGCARLGDTDFRFKLFAWDGAHYTAILPGLAALGLPLLFKPMGGFAVPAYVKELRRDKRYLFLRTRFNRDSECMAMSDIIYSAVTGPAGWALIENPTAKEKRFLAKMGIDMVEGSVAELTGTEEAVTC